MVVFLSPPHSRWKKPFLSCLILKAILAAKDHYSKHCPQPGLGTNRIEEAIHIRSGLYD